LEEKGIPYQYKEVNPYRKEKHFLGTSPVAQSFCHSFITETDINPKGLVPAIEYQGKALYESLILCEFLEDAYPDHKPHLLPADSFERAHARLWIDHTTKAIIPAWLRLVQGQTKEQQDAAREELYEAQRKLAQQVKGPYFAGEEFGLVDVANAPWAARQYILAEHRGYDRTQVGKGWSEYAERLAMRESVGKTTSVGSLCSKIFMLLIFWCIRRKTSFR
jgi:glutathione S-transferase